MTKDEQKAKYSRIANDPSQLEMFKDDLIDGEVSTLPAQPAGTEAKTLVLKLKNGEAVWEEEGASPTPTPLIVSKGDHVIIDNKAYLVLETTGDNTDVKLFALSDTAASSWYDAGEEPWQTPTVEFNSVNAGGRPIDGVKYEDSKLDQLCTAYLENVLSAGVQDALLEKDFIQDMFAVEQQEEHNVAVKTHTSSVTLQRKVHVLSLTELFDYCGTYELDEIGTTFISLFRVLNDNWTSSAVYQHGTGAYMIDPLNFEGDGLIAQEESLLAYPFVPLVFSIDLTQVEFVGQHSDAAGE